MEKCAIYSALRKNLNMPNNVAAANTQRVPSREYNKKNNRN